ncbi:DMT family transporter [Pleionea mediterranea]|uniref:EamA-like transporter family protein n=1 Tax=Pleionea mediterranea TaxID=523701 RepID=A0A316FYK6_9GAMM|nr:DMT family transporter [Pleionea mediterranea]PWK53741.1 EamA-like transporter family protein [Pleionea mediterranea]
MKNTLLYLTTVLIWGTTWFAIEFQLGEVAVEISLFYRFALAAILMWGFCWWKKVPLALSLRNHSFIFLLGLLNFSMNYLVLYWAQNYLTSAMTSIAFSTLLLMNIVNTRIFFGKPIAGRIIIGALLGIIGIIALFWQDLQDFNISSTAIIGLMLTLFGTFLASLGNMVSVRNTANKISVIQGNTWGMLYGTIALLIYALINGSEFTFASQTSYWVSLLYLSLFGTVFAFACYFMLFQNIGPEKASYVIVLFPLVAVVFSTLYEGFVWHQSTILGFILVLSGNAIVLTPFEKILRLIKPVAKVDSSPHQP